MSFSSKAKIVGHASSDITHLFTVPFLCGNTVYLLYNLCGQERNGLEMESKSNLINEQVNGSLSKTFKEETRRYGPSREAISNKYAAKRVQSGQSSKLKPEEKNIASAKVSLLEGGSSRSGNTTGLPSLRLASTWQTMKSGFQSFKANIGAKKFLPLQQMQEDKFSLDSSSESLDEIFHRLKRPSVDQRINNDED